MNKLRNITISALFIATGIVVSFIFHSFGGQLGKIFLPLHFVVLLGGLILGPSAGAIIGATLPILSGLLFGMPPLMPPIAFFMMPELATYGFLCGYFNKKGINLYLNLVLTMLSGRAVYSIAYYAIGAIVGIHLQPIHALFLSFALGIPGIIVQIITIPPVYITLKKHLASRTKYLQ